MQILPPPGPERRRQLVRLAVLMVLLAVVLWFWSGPSVSPSPTSNQAGPVAAPAIGQLPVPDALRLDALGPQGDLDDAGRNPFVYGPQQLPSPPGSSFLTVPQPGPPAGIPAPSGPPVPQGPPPVPLRLTGMTTVTEDGRMLVTLKDTAANVLYQAVEGDIVDGRYRVVKVGLESVVVSYLDGTGQRTLALGR